MTTKIFTVGPPPAESTGADEQVPNGHTPASLDQTIANLRAATDRALAALGGFSASQTPAANNIPVLNSNGRITIGLNDDGRNIIQTAGRTFSYGSEVVNINKLYGGYPFRRNKDLFSMSMGAVSGTLKIKIPNLTSAAVVLTLEGITMTNPLKTWTIKIGFYTPKSTGFTYSADSVIVNGIPPFSDIRLVYDGTNAFLLLGNTSTAWSNTVIGGSVDTTWSGYSLDSSIGWEASIITDETGLTLNKVVSDYSNLFPSSGPAMVRQGLAFPATQYASSDPNTLDDYREPTFTATATGMTTSPTGTVEFVKAGKMVIMQIPAIAGISNTTTFTLTGMPTTCRPSVPRTVILRITDNGIDSFGLAVIGTDGVITIYPTAAGGAFTSAGNKGVKTTNVSYLI